MGIGLCLIHLGELYEKEQKYELATAEYKKAYQLMEEISDKWHWLQACLSIARIHLITDNNAGGKIEFTVSKGKNSDTIAICISDTGEGIAQESLKHIFDLFYQSPQAKNSAGSGIGLAFTQMMVRKMKGEIEVKSKLGVGSQFTVNLPLKNKKLPYIQPLEEDKKQPIALSPQSDFRETEKEELTEILEDEKDNANEKPLILIVEDNRDITLYLKMLLVKKYQVITAWNGVEGLKAAEESIPDLVITDLMMPEKDGFKLACEMKENRLLNHIPIIMVTARTAKEDYIKGLECDVEGYIRKPFQKEELLIRIENILDNRRILKEKYMSAITRSDTVIDTENDENLKFLHTITDIIHSEITNPDLNSTFLADKMAMSISQLNRKTNGITGYSIMSYVLQLKLNKAKKMLVDNDLSVTEVSEACGFSDASYFSRVFKKEFRVSPSHYKKLSTLKQ